MFEPMRDLMLLSYLIYLYFFHMALTRTRASELHPSCHFIEFGSLNNKTTRRQLLQFQLLAPSTLASGLFGNAELCVQIASKFSGEMELNHR